MMRNIFKQLTNKLLAKSLGLKVYSIRAHGREDITDIANTGFDINVIFDVGANKGQSVSKFLAGFPDSAIYAFEPVSRTCKTLVENYGETPNVKINQLALGKKNGRMEIFVPAIDSMASLVKPEGFVESEFVELKTIDTYCRELAISKIDLLKIDAEGYDLEVLKGAQRLLEDRAVKFILIELGFTPNNNYHVLFDRVRDYLAKYDFDIFGIYDQQLEWSGEKRLRYANVCFVNFDLNSA